MNSSVNLDSGNDYVSIKVSTESKANQYISRHYSDNESYYYYNNFYSSSSYYDYENSYESLAGTAVGVEATSINLGDGNDNFNLEVLSGSDSTGLKDSNFNSGKGNDEISIFIEGIGGISSFNNKYSNYEQNYIYSSYSNSSYSSPYYSNNYSNYYSSPVNTLIIMLMRISMNL